MDLEIPRIILMMFFHKAELIVTIYLVEQTTNGMCLEDTRSSDSKRSLFLFFHVVYR